MPLGRKYELFGVNGSKDNGFEAKYSLEQGIKELIKYYKIINI